VHRFAGIMKLIVSLEARGAGSLHQLPHWFCALVLSIVLASAAVAGTFGTVVPISGQASDLALDERRGVLYVANLTANRIDVISLAAKSIQTSWNVAQHPGSVSLSPNGRYLVVTHFRNFEDPTTWSNVVTVMDLDANVKQTYALASPPLGVAFGIDNLAFIATTKDFQLLDPANGTVQILDTVQGVTAKTLPVESPTFPPQIVRASVGASGDGLWVYGTAETGGENQSVAFRYNVTAKQVTASYWTASPPLGPRVVSVAKDGSVWLSGWGLFAARGYLLAEFRNASGIFNVGSHAVDITRGPYGTIYAEVAEATAAAAGPPILQITDADNLTIRERLYLPEHLAGKSALSADGAMVYSVSDSGVIFLPVGSLDKSPRVVAAQEDLVFRGNFCDRGIIAQDIDIVDPGGGKTEFSLSTTMKGVMFSPGSGVTPAKVRVMVDPSAFQNYRGTVSGFIQINSSAAVNVPPLIRVLVNNREPDQRGAVINIPGTLVDILMDAPRNLFYVLRQDKNQVLIFQASTYKQIGVFRTGNTPTSMAMTLDRQYLLIGNDDSQVANVIDLIRMQPTYSIVFPGGHYPRSIATSGNAILVASRVAGPVHTIDRIDLNFDIAVTLPNLGIYKNDINLDTVLAGSPSGGTIFIAQANGNVMLYQASSDTFVAARKDFTALSGAYGALSDSRFVVDNNLLNSSLVPIQQFESGTGLSSGIVMADQYALRTTALSAANPGVIQRLELGKSAVTRPTRMIEAPLVKESTTVTVPEECQVVFGQTLCKPATTTDSTVGSAFKRTLAAQPERRLIFSLTTSGLTVLPWDYDAATADPRLEAVTSAADGSGTVAVGGLITIWGHDLSLTSAATSQIPLPTILGDSCLTVNGVLIPMSLVSPGQINAQLPYSVTGEATMVLRSPAGVSNNLIFTVQPTAAGVFRTGTVGAEKGLATVVRATNGELVTLSNPIHPEDWIVIYAAGLGVTTPTVPTGYPGPSDPLAQVLIQPEVTLGDVSLPIGYAGLVPGQVGVYQINAYVPYWAPLGMEIPLRIAQGGSSTTLMVRVVK
jgi:uncharacterized protein (TIGR03437 family)